MKKWKILLLLLSYIFSAGAYADSPVMGMVIMHGKGGAPTKHVADLASALKDKGYLVANLEMPWSDNREYDANVSHAEAEVESALADLRSKGAKAVFIAGHSQGGGFAMHLARKSGVNGIIAITPGGNVGASVYQEKLGEYVTQARQLVAEGKGNQKAGFFDYEGKKGVYKVTTTPANYLDWFDPDGAMNAQRSAQSANPQTPILWIVAKNDYPSLRKLNIPLFDKLPHHALTKFYESDSDHLGAPSASLDEIVSWSTQVSNAARP